MDLEVLLSSNIYGLLDVGIDNCDKYFINCIYIFGVNFIF